MHPLTFIRDELNMSAYLLSRRSGIPETALARYERGEGKLFHVERRALSQALFAARLEQAQKRAADRRIAKACRELRLLRKKR